MSTYMMPYYNTKSNTFVSESNLNERLKLLERERKRLLWLCGAKKKNRR